MIKYYQVESRLTGLFIRAVVLFSLVIISPTCLKAQDFNHLLGLPSDSTIHWENLKIAQSTAEINTKLLSANNIIGSGFTLTYSVGCFYNNIWQNETTTFVFDVRDRLVAGIVLLREKGQLEEMHLLLSGDYFEVSQHILYHKTQDLKITVFNRKDETGKDEAIFRYSRKDYIAQGN